jgi:hypothetical protein
MNLIDKYPKTSFMIIVKLYWVVGFFFTVYIIQNQMPSIRQFLLGSIYTILTLPLNYWLTYSFGGTKNG